MGRPYLRDCFHFFLLSIWACAVQHLEEVRCFCSHTCVNIGLSAKTIGTKIESGSRMTALLSLEVIRKVWGTDTLGLTQAQAGR